ncbi:MAG: insulinase family protein [Oscillospiraceae bacterium]|nr:insulinase family protein [Oscillospiraceae bacterium]
MKKLLSVFLALALLLGAGFADGRSAASAETPDAALPAVGDTVEGFTVKELRDFPLVGATAVLFEHDRTGAQLMYIANSDTNRIFDLTFFTRAVDNTGLPHVFEHSTLDGSEKYPSKALFFNLIYQTYNSYMNAFTYPLFTSYPVGSLSEAQLLRYADYYTDSCLHPSIMTDESIFREEAWRYRLADAEDELAIEGTVYSEMKGAMDLQSTASRNYLRTAFPGSLIGNVSGGEPEFIPDMTWESLQDFHNQYYHPSNCIAYLYGQFEDYTAFLKLLDEAFAPFEKQEFRFEDPDYVPLTESVEESFAFPVEASANTENRSAIYYAFLCPGVKDDPKTELVLNTLTDLMADDASPLQQRLKKALPSGSFATYIETTGPEDAIVFYAQNVNAEDAPVFRETVDAALAEIAEKGFAQELVDSVTSSLSLSMKLIGEGDDVGVNVISQIAYSHASSGRVFDYMDYVDAMGKLDDWNREGLYRKAVAEHLTDGLTALVSTYPEPGLREELDAAEAARLAEVKAAMSAEELQAIIDATNAEDEEDDASAYVAALQAVNAASLPEEMRSYAITDETGDDGVRRISAEAGVDGVSQVMLLLDASGLPQEDIHWFALYTALLGELETAEHSREELAALTGRYFYDGEIRLSLMDRYGTDEYRPNLRASWIAEDEDLDEGYGLLYELLYETSFEDSETLLGLIQQNKASLKNDVNNAPYNVMIYRAFGAYSPLYAYYSYFNYLDYYAFLEQVEALMAENPAAVAGKLQEVQQYFHNRTNAIAACAASADGIAVNAPLADAFLEKLDAEPIEPQSYRFEPCAASEALVVDSSVQFNGVIADFKALGLDGYSAAQDAVASLISDSYLYPMLRDQYGVYSVFHAFSEDVGTYVVTYRDPNVKESFAVLEDMAGYVSGLELDQESLDGYILSSYSGYAMPEGELSGALSAILSRLSEEPEDLKLQHMRELKALTPEALQSYADVYAKLLEEGVRFTAGGAAAINENAELYDAILNPFGSVDSTQVVLTDLPEDAEHYEAVRFVFENKLMNPLGEDSFGVDEPGTMGDLAGALYALIGGDASAQQDALDTLSLYEILPAGSAPDDPLTGAQAEEILTVFGTAAEVPYTAQGAADEAVTRAELAELLMSFVQQAG